MGLDGGSTRPACVERLAAWIAATERGHAVRVAVDGPDAAGKTVLAAELAGILREVHGRVVAQASVDAFQRPGAHRHRRGRLSPEGYLFDAFDHATMRTVLLDPLGPGGSGVFLTRVFDVVADRPVAVRPASAPPGMVLLVDGVFLQRPELADCWDATIWVDVSAPESLRRAVERDAEAFGSEAAVLERYTRRYLPAQELYRTTDHPDRRAGVVVHNDDPQHLRLTWNTHG